LASLNLSLDATSLTSGQYTATSVMATNNLANPQFVIPIIVTVAAGQMLYQLDLPVINW
jgi:hypothetical protein